MVVGSEVFLGDVGYIVEDIGYLGLLGVEHITINNEFVFDLDTLVIEGRGRAVVRGSRSLSLMVWGW